MKLSYKIYAVHVLVSFLLLFLIMATFKFYAFKHLKEFIARHEGQSLVVATQELAQRYDPITGWSLFQESPEALEKIVKTAFQNSPPFFPPPGPDHGGFPRPWQGFEAGKDRPGESGPDHGRPPEHKPPHFPPEMQPERRTALYDIQKNHVAGPMLDKDGLLFHPIGVGGKIVGWLGFLKTSKVPPPMDEQELKEKLHAVYVIGFFIFILTGIVSYFLSRYLLAPIKELTLGTKALTRFNFKTRINVRTHDELGQLGEDFNTMAKTLQDYETMKEQWMLDISHELRTPISILKGETEAMLDGIRKIDCNRIRSLHGEICHLETMVNDLHYLSRKDAQALVMEKYPMNPIPILEDVLALFKPRLKTSDLTIINNLTDKPFIIKGNRDRLKQLFTNLIENNLRYTSKPGTISIWEKSRAGFLFLYIDDSGPGVPEESIDRIFDRLYRVDRSRSRKGGGTGLGLSICKTIVKAHEGSIVARNSPGRGLRIEIRLPLAQDLKSLPMDLNSDTLDLTK